MKRNIFIPLIASLALNASSADYTTGVFFINEDWYGHQNSTVNHLTPDATDGDYWQYRVIQQENDGRQLGCTAQAGAIWYGRFFIIAKQDKDPGASVAGGRITVADAKTLQIIHQSAQIDPSGAQCDGRGFLGIDTHKAYVSSSNGVWVLDLDTYTITRQVEGTANPNAGNDKPNTDPTGGLYHGQSGTMVLAAGKVFIAHQQAGLLVADPATDTVTQTISMDIVQEGAGIGSIVKDKDGILWVSIAVSVQGTGTPAPYLLRVDPATMETEVVNIVEPSLPPANTWYAWTPDAFCASSVSNTLFWKGSAGRWFDGTQIYSFDTHTRKITKIIDLTEDPDAWKIYGCSMRVHPITDEIYCSLLHEVGKPVYVTRRYTSAGTLIKEYPMINNYWFPSIPVFPEDPANDPGNASLSVTDKDATTPLIIPVAGGVRILSQSGLQISIYTASGLLVQQITIPTDDHTINLPSGMYIVRSPRQTQKTVVR